MQNKLSQFERRMEILSILRRRIIVKRSVLAQEFSVSNVTISDDLNALGCYVPIRTKPGPYGGIYLSQHYCYGRDYLSIEEVDLLNQYLKNATEKDACILKHILHKFSMPQ